MRVVIVGFAVSMLLSFGAAARQDDYVTYVNYTPSIENAGPDGSFRIEASRVGGRKSSIGYEFVNTKYCGGESVQNCVQMGNLILSVPKSSLPVGSAWTEVLFRKVLTSESEWKEVPELIAYSVVSEEKFSVLGREIPVFVVQGTYAKGEAFQYFYNHELGIVAIVFLPKTREETPQLFLLSDAVGLFPSPDR